MVDVLQTGIFQTSKKFKFKKSKYYVILNQRDNETKMHKLASNDNISYLYYIEAHRIGSAGFNGSLSSTVKVELELKLSETEL